MILKSSLLFLTYTVFALPVGHKFSFRFMDLSKSGEIARINKGHEDGLKKDDHGIVYEGSTAVGRARVIELSPRRSIWEVFKTYSPLKKDWAYRMTISKKVLRTGLVIEEEKKVPLEFHFYRTKRLQIAIGHHSPPKNFPDTPSTVKTSSQSQFLLNYSFPYVQKNHDGLNFGIIFQHGKAKRKLKVKGNIQRESYLEYGPGLSLTKDLYVSKKMAWSILTYAQFTFMQVRLSDIGSYHGKTLSFGSGPIIQWVEVIKDLDLIGGVLFQILMPATLTRGAEELKSETYFSPKVYVGIQKVW